MLDRLEFVYQYRLLTARVEQRIPLNAEEQARLQRLRRLLPAHVPADNPREVSTRLTSPMHVRVVYGDVAASGALRNLSGAGMAVEMREPPPLGQRVQVSVDLPHERVELLFAARVVSRTVRGRRGAGLAFEGMPSQRSSAKTASGVWRAKQVRDAVHKSASSDE